MKPISVLRLNMLRALYLLVVVGLGLTVWPQVADPGRHWSLMGGVVQCMLAAFSALAILGLRYPLQMLPLLLWEITWKVIWLSVVAWPLWSAGKIDAATAEVAATCLLIAIFPFLIPWDYVLARYLKQRAEPWRAARPRDSVDVKSFPVL